MGSREAAQIVHLQMQSNPNKQLVPESFTGLAQSMKAMNNYMIAKNSAIQAQSGADNDSALQAASAWTSKIDPRVWALSLSPDLATKFASSVGTAKIATAIPMMAHDDGISVIRNLPASMRPGVLASLPLPVKQEILNGMQQTGATGRW
jgi:Mg/Co/Ni transporter MgtE